MKLTLSEGFDYFDHQADMGIIGRGKTLEGAFIQAACAVFANMADLSQVKNKKTIFIEFTEADNELALVEWLNLLIGNARAQDLVFNQFSLKREDQHWSGSASGEGWNETIERGTEVKGATLTMLSVKENQGVWEARCVIDV
jgi:SHS2 domain-containing protein